MALGSPHDYESLLFELTSLAAQCYGKCAHLRISGLLYADLSLMQLQRGLLMKACSLMDHVTQVMDCSAHTLGQDDLCVLRVTRLPPKYGQSHNVNFGLLHFGLLSTALPPSMISSGTHSLLNVGRS